MKEREINKNTLALWIAIASYFFWSFYYLAEMLILDRPLLYFSNLWDAIIFALSPVTALAVPVFMHVLAILVYIDPAGLYFSLIGSTITPLQLVPFWIGWFLALTLFFFLFYLYDKALFLSYWEGLKNDDM